MVQKIGPNDPCSCGSGKKFKQCCGTKNNIVEFPLKPFTLNSFSSQDSPPENVVYQVKITIREIKPSIWRRLLIPSNITFNKFHKIIQVAFGWQNYHLFNFDFMDTVVCIPDPEYGPGKLYGDVKELNAKREKIDRLLLGRRRCIYEYDFGDSWEHDVILEDLAMPQEEQKYPLCLEGARHRPPEDIGGVRGYEDFLQIIENPEHPEYNDCLLWAEKDTGGRKFDPDYFYLNEVNRALAKIR